MARIAYLAIAMLAFAQQIHAANLSSAHDALSGKLGAVVCGYERDILAIAASEDLCITPIALIDTKGTLHAASIASGMSIEAFGTDMVSDNKVFVVGCVSSFTRGQKVHLVGMTDDHQGHVTLQIFVSN